MAPDPGIDARTGGEEVALKTPTLTAIGGAHIDRRGRITGSYVPGASNPGIMREEVGGGAFNALRTAVQRGVAGTVISLRGGDMAGETVAHAVATAGIRDLPAVFLDRATPSYTALIDGAGDVIAGLADMALYDLAFAKHLVRRGTRDEIARSDAVLADANLPSPAIERLVSLAGGKPVYGIAISPAKVRRFAGALPALSVLFMNNREAAALREEPPDTDSRRLADELAGKGLRAGIITAGAEQLTGFDRDGVFRLKPPPLEAIADATGAGDALAGATIAAMMHGLPLRAALREGVAAAIATLADRGAVASLPEARFRRILATVPECE